MCSSTTKDSLVRVAENGKSFVLDNANRDNVEIVKVDGCAIKVGERCDYLYRLASAREIFVELKGADVRKAVQQIIASIPILSKVKDKSARAAVVVASRVPRTDTATQLAQARMRATQVQKLWIKSGMKFVATEAAIFS